MRWNYGIFRSVSLVAIALVEVKIYKVNLLICHMNSRNMWSKEYVALWLDIWLLIISHPSIKFDRDRSRESEFKIFLISLVTLCDHIINRLSDLMDNNLTLKPTTLPSLVAIGLADVEI